MLVAILNSIYRHFITAAIVGMAVTQGKPPMTEFVATLLALISMGVFVAHALDAYRTG